VDTPEVVDTLYKIYEVTDTPQEETLPVEDIPLDYIDKVYLSYLSQDKIDILLARFTSRWKLEESMN
jgi:hypothetical protein